MKHDRWYAEGVSGFCLGFDTVKLLMLTLAKLLQLSSPSMQAASHTDIHIDCVHQQKGHTLVERTTRVQGRDLNTVEVSILGKESTTLTLNSLVVRDPYQDCVCIAASLPCLSFRVTERFGAEVCLA